MMIRSSSIAFAVLSFAITVDASAKPPSREEYERQTKVVEQLKMQLASDAVAETKFANVARVMKEEVDADVRRKVVEAATRVPGPELEQFLNAVLVNDEDAGIRSQAAKLIGQLGSEKCLAALATAAASDRTTDCQFGCIRDRSSARRDATFALAELGTRFPRIADACAVKLRDLPVNVEENDRHGLNDARIQALYQITRDEALLKPFYERLASNNDEVRVNGIVAFRFLRLKVAPAEVVNALTDSSREVRTWSALVLGEIGDPKTAAPLMAIASDAKADRGLRCNAIASLGQMKAADAVELMETLLQNPDEGLQVNAAIALFRITGRKVAQFPAGYSTD